MKSFVGFIPGLNIGMVVLTNGIGHTVHKDMFAKFYELYFDLPPSGVSSPLPLLDRKPEKTMTAPVDSSTESASSISRYVGVYKNPAYGKAVVKKEGSSLVLFLGPEMIEGSLTPKNGHRFLWTISDWPESEADVTFVTSPSGEVRSLVFDQLKEVRKGVFVKIR